MNDGGNREGERINVARWVPVSEANGPGKRFVLWVQGCPLGCPGCWNPDTWDNAPRNLHTPSQVMDEVLARRDEIEGVTFSGGEPMAQADALLPLARMIQEAGLTLMIFSGLRRDEMRSASHDELLAHTDILVSGRYRREERDLSLRWRGSRNQTVHFLTSAYSNASADEGAEVEVVLDEDGAVTVTGFPDDELLELLSDS